MLVLGPLALLCMYGIAARIGGRLLAYWTSFLWVIAPFAVIPLFVDRYQERWSEQFLPQALGLTAMADFPSMVVVLAGVLFVVRSLSPGRVPDAVMAGLLIGAAGALKPPNLLVVAGVGLAYVVARRWREGLACGAAIVPALLVLLLWKVRGLGEIPAFALEQAPTGSGLGPARRRPEARPLLRPRLRALAGADGPAARVLLERAARAVGSGRRARRRAARAARRDRGAARGLARGLSRREGLLDRATIESGSFWRLLMPAWPAYLLLVASIPLLVPTLARRLGDRVQPPASSNVSLRWIGVVAVVTVAIPAVAIAASTPLELSQTKTVVQDFPSGNILTPVDDGVELRVERTDAGQRLTWTGDGSWRADVFYRVYRYDGPGDDTVCFVSGGVAVYCVLSSEPIATTRALTFVDESAPATATYRIGVGTNWVDDPEEGDVFAFSLPVAAAG